MTSKDESKAIIPSWSQTQQSMSMAKIKADQKAIENCIKQPDLLGGFPQEVAVPTKHRSC